ncbi:hypothetical protein MMC30_004318 [Trapelia coarctata]|nr:hypothetical protein [Trapelia coarctata]
MAFNSLSPALLTHPFMFELLQMTIIIIVIGFTSTSSIIRPAISPLILAISVYSLPRCFDKVQHTIWLGILGGNSTASILQYIELAFLGRYAIEFGGPSNPDRNLRFKQGQEAKAKAIRAKGHYTVWERIKFGVSSLSNHRLIGTLFEVSGVPPFSSKDPDYVPTRSEFLRRRSLTVLLCYLVIDLLGAAPHDPGMIATTYPAQLVPFFSRLGEVTVEQINMRFITSIMTWVSVYCIIHASHGVMATIGVASGLTEVKDWPPSFGSLGDAYTVRGFWGCVLTLAMAIFLNEQLSLTLHNDCTASSGTKLIGTNSPPHLHGSPTPSSSSVKAAS